eukprot:2555152-Rhodomonas_salina.2
MRAYGGTRRTYRTWSLLRSGANSSTTSRYNQTVPAPLSACAVISYAVLWYMCIVLCRSLSYRISRMLLCGVPGMILCRILPIFELAFAVPERVPCLALRISSYAFATPCPVLTYRRRATTTSRVARPLASTRGCWGEQDEERGRREEEREEEEEEEEEGSSGGEDVSGLALPEVRKLYAPTRTVVLMCVCSYARCSTDVCIFLRIVCGAGAVEGGRGVV